MRARRHTFLGVSGLGETLEQDPAVSERRHLLGGEAGPSCMDNTNANSKVTPEYATSGNDDDDHDALHRAYDHGYHG